MAKDTTVDTQGRQATGIVIGTEEGRTPYSGQPDALYASTSHESGQLDISEYYSVTQGYLREWVCMSQCNLYLQVACDLELKRMIELYRRDVCAPNETELGFILQQYGYSLPQPYNAVTDGYTVAELGSVATNAIDDQKIMIGHIFTVQGFMELWNMGAMQSHKADVREAFIRNYHRANRWHLASYAIVQRRGWISRLPEVTR